jgi:hypothetical protein
LIKEIRPYSAFILFVALVFFIFLLNIFLNSFFADYRIAIRNIASYQSTGSLSPLFHLGSEITGEVGVILRFTGACIMLTFAFILAWKRTFSKSILRKAILLEGIYYLFNIPFIVYLFTRPYALVNYGAATSYLAQILLVTPIFLIFYFKLKKEKSDTTELAKWGSLAIVGFVFALWAKHFLLAIYALPLNFSNLTFTAGFLNSVLTLLVAGIILLLVLMPLYRKKSMVLNTKGLGIALIVAGLYALDFLVISLFNIQYARWISLIDWWTIVFVLLGIGFLIVKKESEQSPDCVLSAIAKK